ncbi:rCG46326 [Rattus norvegicus]|uniref:RCG46326 n=1 Tax=Rattus norvegicus TaxID=10116 RepID=A6ID61_RAT|nr:rCG46326 [Rattus norvegicus]
MQRPWRDVSYWLASNGLLSLLSYTTQDYQPRDGITHNGLDPPTLTTS